MRQRELEGFDEKVGKFDEMGGKDENQRHLVVKACLRKRLSVTAEMGIRHKIFRGISDVQHAHGLPVFRQLKKFLFFSISMKSIIVYLLNSYNDLSVDLAFVLSGDSFAEVLKIKHLPTDRDQFLFLQENKDLIHDLLRGII